MTNIGGYVYRCMGRHGWVGWVGGVKLHDKHWGICAGMHGNVWVGWVGQGMGGSCGVDGSCDMGGVKLHDKH